MYALRIAALAALLALLSVLSEQALAETGSQCGPPTIEFDKTPRKKAEELVPFNWSSSSPSCKQVRFLVASFPNTVRFAGKGFFVLAPGEPGPNKLKWALDSMRVFIPLHYGPETASGSLSVRFLTTGIVDIEWAYFDFPQGQGSRETKLSSARFEVLPGRPQLSVVDRFSDVLPEKSYHDTNLQYRLDVWPGHYRVTNLQSGAVIVARDGERPAFSPTGRFVAAFRRGTHSLEVTDVLSRKIEGVAGSGEMHGGYGGYGRIDAVTWGASDSFLVAGEAGYGGAYVLQTYIDRPAISTGMAGGPTHPWQDTTLEIDVDLGVIWRGYVGQGETDPARPNATLLGAYQRSDGSGDGEFIESRLLPTLANWSDRPEPKNPAWRLPGIPVITHDALADDEIRASQSPFLLKPIEVSVSEASEIHIVSDSTRRGFSPVSDEQVGYEQRSSSQLATFGVVLNRSDPGRLELSVLPAEGFEKSKTRIFQFLIRLIKPEPELGRSFYHPDSSPCMNAQPFGEFIDPLGIRFAWTWKVGGTSLVLFQSHCEIGNGGLEGIGALQLLVLEGKKIRLLQLDSDLGIEQQKAVLPILLDQEHLAIVGTNRAMLIYDFSSAKITRYATDIPGGDIVRSLNATANGKHYVQTNSDGQLTFYNVTDGKQALTGYFIDDEVVLYTSDGYYDATFEGAAFVNLRFAGIGKDFELTQFERQLRRPDVIRAIIEDQGRSSDPVSLPVPPTIQLTAQGQVVDRKLAVTINGQAAEGLSSVDVYLDGTIVDHLAVSGETISVAYSLALPPGTRRADFVATDQRGVRSTASTIEFELEKMAGNGGRRLKIIAIGTDVYGDSSLSKLTYAVSDARRFVEAAGKAYKNYYDSVTVVPLLDEADLNGKLDAALKALVKETDARDTVMIFIAGHGLQDKDGALFIAGKSTRIGELADTAVAWKDVSRWLQSIPARTAVFLDVCHAGAAGSVGTNEDAAADLAARNKALTIFAASKGRQFSLESGQLKGGEFTVALTNVLASAVTYDANHNGTLEVSELYKAAKATVVSRTSGGQTPWIARNGFVGDVPLF